MINEAYQIHSVVDGAAKLSENHSHAYGRVSKNLLFD